jgi:hypothetical protein
VHLDYYIRSLYEPWSRNRGNATLTAFIEAYVAVQYNAIRDFATQGNSNIYNPDWHGPPAVARTPDGMLSSLDVLAFASVFDGNVTNMLK